MDFVFWQNIISIHQKAFLEALATQPGTDKVVLVVEHELTPVRKEMGWDTPTLQGVEVVLSPTEAQVDKIVTGNKDAVHVMGGIKIGRMISRAFDTCLQHKCRVGIMTEPYDNAGVKGMLRGMKYRYYAARYFRHIDFVLAIGRQGMSQYTSLGYRADRLFAWAYFITLNRQEVSTVTGGDMIKVIYAGRLEPAKGILRFVRELAATGRKNFKLDIYGSGPDKEGIQAVIKEWGCEQQVSLVRFIKYQELLARYAGYDWVLLPSSQKDGWGVIISEGLLNGLRAMCSSICGVSWVIRNGHNGLVFDWNTATGSNEQLLSCRSAIEAMFNGENFDSRDEIAAQAQATISGEAGAKYFMKIVDCVYKGAVKPAVPWLAH